MLAATSSEQALTALPDGRYITCQVALFEPGTLQGGGEPV